MRAAGVFESRGQRWVVFAWVAAVVCVVSDGWSGKPSLLVHQLLLLPCSVAFVMGLVRLLRSGDPDDVSWAGVDLPSWWLVLLSLFQLLSVAMIDAEARHFQRFGYTLAGRPVVVGAVLSAMAWLLFVRRRSGAALFLAVLTTYAAGMLVAIRCFPLNYLRSDMLPVISWADERMVQHLNPYGTMHVGTRLYDFPYLPGMLVAFWPAQAMHLDLRFATLGYVVAASLVVFVAARPGRRMEVAALLGVFLLCPFLQYRHDLYLAPHWFSLALAVVLMQRRRFAWSALVWGASCAIYQLSWVVVPFFLLHAFRRRGVSELLKATVLTVFGALILAGPFLRSASHQVAHNTVGQWDRLSHALADPMNVSFWLTYLVRPSELKWVQAAVLSALFAFCCVRRRCRTTADTVRWMACALAVFIPLNVLVDGYFYLTLLLFLLLYVCLISDWWSGPAMDREIPADLCR